MQGQILITNYICESGHPRQAAIKVFSLTCLLQLSIFFSSHCSTTLVALGRLYEVLRSHLRQHTQYDSSGRVICPLQRILPDNTQHSQETDINDLAELEPAIPTSEPPQTYASDCSASGIGQLSIRISLFWQFNMNNSNILTPMFSRSTPPSTVTDTSHST